MVKRFICIKVLHEDGEHATPTHVRVVAEIDYDALSARLAEAITMLSERDFEYNRKTNALIERHAKQIEGLLARLAAVEEALRLELLESNKVGLRLAEARHLLSTWLEWAEHRAMTPDQFNDLVWRSQDVEDGTADSAEAITPNPPCDHREAKSVAHTMGQDILCDCGTMVRTAVSASSDCKYSEFPSQCDDPRCDEAGKCMKGEVTK